MAFKRVRTSPMVVTSLGQQYNIGEKPTVILYTNYINRHVGTLKKIQSRNTVSPGVQLDYSNNNMVLEKARVKLNLINVNM